jgi:hypothetical protein
MKHLVESPSVGELSTLYLQYGSQMLARIIACGADGRLAGDGGDITAGCVADVYARHVRVW